jgi:hypothetical protein
LNHGRKIDLWGRKGALLMKAGKGVWFGRVLATFFLWLGGASRESLRSSIRGISPFWGCIAVAEGLLSHCGRWAELQRSEEREVEITALLLPGLVGARFFRWGQRQPGTLGRWIAFLDGKWQRGERKESGAMLEKKWQRKAEVKRLCRYNGDA